MSDAPTFAPTRIRVALTPPAAPYDIVIGTGAITSLGSLVADIAPAPHYVVIADATVARLHGKAVLASLDRISARIDLLEFPPGERSKTRDTWASLTDALLDTGFRRDGCILALGGGVTGDLAGFVAATFMRGVPYVQVPTSLLAMIDASIGGKTAVDTPAGKNLVGAFAHPRFVAVDPLLLATLPDEMLRAGLAEAVKHAAIADAEYLRWIGERRRGILGRDAPALERLIRRSVEIKAAIVTRDPDEQGERACLNFGHTIGHALERVMDFAIPHGFAVAIGMVAEATIGEVVGVTQEATAATLCATLAALELPVAPPLGIDAEQLLAAAGNDKKVRERRLRFSLLTEPGRPARSGDGDWTFPVEHGAVEAALALVARSSGARKSTSVSRYDL